MENKVIHSASISDARLLWKTAWVVVYGITAFYACLSFASTAYMTKWMMYAMAWMAGGMLAEAIVDLIYRCCGENGNECHQDNNNLIVTVKKRRPKKRSSP